MQINIPKSMDHRESMLLVYYLYAFRLTACFRNHNLPKQIS
ncbi:hypothetical protein [Neobacillus sp. LXY-4]